MFEHEAAITLVGGTVAVTVTSRKTEEGYFFS
jgi:hypothetical protein